MQLLPNTNQNTSKFWTTLVPKQLLSQVRKYNFLLNNGVSWLCDLKAA